MDHLSDGPFLVAWFQMVFGVGWICVGLYCLLAKFAPFADLHLCYFVLGLVCVVVEVVQLDS